MKKFIVALALTSAAIAAPAFSAVGVSIRIGEPGFYGQLDIGDDYYRPRSGVFFGLGLGSSYYDPYDSYYGDPYYSEPVYRPRVIQRRVYRSGGSGHVQWCYNRYRSYRAWDNSFQPYNGPRQLCYSPYS